MSRGTVMLRCRQFSRSVNTGIQAPAPRRILGYRLRPRPAVCFPTDLRAAFGWVETLGGGQLCGIRAHGGKGMSSA